MTTVCRGFLRQSVALSQLYRALFFSLLVLFGNTAFAQQQPQQQPAEGYSGEYIDSFRAHFVIRDDGSVLVEETIRVYAKRDAIKRGIYRAFPNNKRMVYHRTYLPVLDLSVERDGLPENIGKEEINSNAYTAYFGHSDRFLPKNRFYTYTLRYRMPKAIYQFEEADNFDWNVIGHQWDFAIRSWEVTVSYPAAASVLDDKVFTGPYGSETAAKLDRITRTDGQVVLSGAPLNAREGVTYVLRFDPSLVSPGEDYPVLNEAYFEQLEREREAALEAERQRQEQLAAERAADRALLIAEAESMLLQTLCLLLAFVLLWVAALALWVRVGRQKSVLPVVAPQFFPPSFIGPAASRYINRLGNTNPTKLLVTGLVSLAVKGCIRLEDRNIERISAKESNLTPAEIGILNDLNLGITGKSFSLKKRSDSKAKRLRKAGKNLTKRLRDEYRDTYRTNWPWLVLTLLAINAIWFVGVSLTQNYVVLLLWPLSGLSMLLGLVVLRAGQNLLSTGTVIYTLSSGGLLYAAVNWIPLGQHPFYLPVHLSFVASAILVYFVRVHISNFSQAGSEIAAQLRGLEMYIKAAERGTLKDEPDPDFSHFSAIYPYAFALGLHTLWASKFARDLEVWAADEQLSSAYWYGTDDRSFEDTLDKFEDRFASSYSYSTSSSSGSGGSSFSGGGGGGGGGGGW